MEVGIAEFGGVDGIIEFGATVVDIGELGAGGFMAPVGGVEKFPAGAALKFVGGSVGMVVAVSVVPSAWL